MNEDRSLEILKQAILLEKRGKAFYRTVAENAENKKVSAFFASMAEEEAQHVRILSEQFKAYRKSGTFIPEPSDRRQTGDVATGVLSTGLQDKIAAADFEAAAISAAMAMEERAVKLYASQADAAADPAEKALYHWLADWETGHLEALAAMDKALTEQIWHDNSFWPF